MTLSLSSETLPSAPIDELRRGARRRDLEGVELVVETIGTRQAGEPPRSALTGLPDVGEGQPPIQWLLLGEEATLTELLYWNRQAHLIEAGLVLQKTAVETPLCVPLALLHPTDPGAAHRAAAWAQMHDANTCWEVALGTGDEAQMKDVLDATAPTLAHVRVRGARPEAGTESSEEPGMGTLLKELTLRGYSGTVSLAPSAQGTESAWRDWLFDERGWGCNTAAKKKAA